MKVKICGLMNELEAVVCSRAGADFLGLIFAPSRRQIDLKQAVRIIEKIRLERSTAEIVGVFVNLPSVTVNAIARVCGLDRVQLSGEETWDYCLSIEKPVIKVIHMTPETRTEVILREIETHFSWIMDNKTIILLDSKIPGVYGGTGQTIDWKVAKNICSHFPVLVAGGLTPLNVGEMVKSVKPWGVDVSSGVETEGKKDILKIQQFITIAKSSGI